VIDKLLAALNPGQSVDQRDATVLALESLAPQQERVARALADVLASDSSALVRSHALALMPRRKFGFEIEALIAALDDPSPEVSLTAGSHLARIGLSDPRVIPALCKAARKANELTREGAGINLERLTLDTARNDLPDDQLAQRYTSAVRELSSLLQTKGAAGRPQIVTVLTRFIASCEKTRENALLEPTKTAVAVILARMEDETEDVPLRLDCMNQFDLLQLKTPSSSRSGAPTEGNAPVLQDQLHSRFLWIMPLGRMFKSRYGAIRSRAVALLLDCFNYAHADASYAEAWRQVVPLLVEATRGPDCKTRDAALTILGLLGPEAAGALNDLRGLAREVKAGASYPSA
jgi:hypothetical protein